MVTCSNCGVENPDRAKFCLECGSTLEGRAKTEVRKVVTLVFTDLSGSTAMGERLDPESTRGLMSTYFDRMSAVLEHHGGTVEKFVGDAVMAVFGLPVLHEDDALRGVRAAAGMRMALQELNRDFQDRYGVTIQIRTGVNTGEVVAGDPSSGQNMVTGDPVNLAARLEQAAGPGEILIGEETYRLTRAAVEVEPVEPLTLKGKSQPVPAYRLLSVTATGEGFGRRLDSPLVGREDELRRLHQALDSARQERRAFQFTVFGSAGTGKSRLVAEFTKNMNSEARVMTGRCLAYGEGITFWPIAEMVKTTAGIEDDSAGPDAITRIAELLGSEEDRDLVAGRVASIIGLSEEPTSSEEGFWALRRLWEALGRDRPLIVVIDDIHWAEPTLLDLIEYVTGWAADASILVLCTAREEVLERRPSLGIPKPNASSVLLEPLSAAQSRRLVSQLLDEAAIAESAAERIADAAEGNPLYVEEMLRMMVDDGLLVKQEGRWVATADLMTVSVPPTINALISARLDLLSPEERSVIQRGSIAGRSFWWGAVTHLSSSGERPSVTKNLQTLVRKELVRPERSTLAGEDAFRFGHILVRDAAYQGLPKDHRADLHVRLHDWLEAKLGAAKGFEEILGYHLEQAAAYKRQLGRADASLSQLESRAAAHLDTAGQRARARSDLPAAKGFFSRASALMAESDPRKGFALLDAAEIAIELGELSEAATKLHTVSEMGGRGDRLLEAHAQVMRGYLATHVDADVDEARTIARAAIATFEEFGDERGMARGHQLLAESYWVELKYRDAEENLRSAIEHARAADDPRQVGSSRRWLVSSLFYGPTPASEALELCRQIDDDAGGDQLLLAFSLRAQAGLHALNADFPRANELVANAMSVLRELGVAYSLASTGMVAATIHHLAGDLDLAEAEYKAAVEALEELGDRSYQATASGELARVLLDAGRVDEAETYAQSCRAMAAEDDVISEGLWRGALARIASSRGDHEGAQRLATEAVRAIESTDDTRGHADALADLAEVLVAAGERDAARATYEKALDLYGAKGVVPGAQKVSATLVELGA